MVKPEWGTKRTCTDCGAGFYDMRKSPVVCPKCDTVLEFKSAKPRKKPEPAPKQEPEAVKKDDEIEEIENGLENDGISEIEDDDLIEDASDLGEDDDDMSEVREHLEEVEEVA